MSDKQPMQADGGGKATPDPTQDPKGGTGESAGGAQPGERGSGEDAETPGYHGPGQLGGAVPGSSGGQGG